MVTRSGILPGTSAAQVNYSARSEGELRAAIQRIALRGRPATITIAGPFVIKSPITIPAACAGLTVRGSGRHQLYSRNVVDSLFIVTAPDVTIEYVQTARLAADRYFRTFCTAEVASGYAPTLLNNYAKCERLYFQSASFVGIFPTIVGNVLEGSGADNLDCITVADGFGGRVIGNRLLRSGGSGNVSLRLSGNSSEWTIVGNVTDAAIDTSACAANSQNRLAANTGQTFGNLASGDIDADLADRVSFVEISDVDHTAGIGERLVAYDALTATRTVTLPTATDFGERQITIKDETGNASAAVKIVVQVDGGGTIDGAASKEITTAYGSVTLYATGNGGAWYTMIPAAASAAWTTVTKAATETRISDGAVYADDAELLFPMAANTTYRVRGVAFFTTFSTPDFKWRINGPAAPTRIAATQNLFNSAAAPAGGALFGVADTYLETEQPMLGVTGPGSFSFECVIENGANAGNFAIQWAQNTNSATNTAVLKGSYLEYAVV